MDIYGAYGVDLIFLGETVVKGKAVYGDVFRVGTIFLLALGSDLSLPLCNIVLATPLIISNCQGLMLALFSHSSGY